MTVDDFNRRYLELHTRKEDLYWTTYMGVQPDNAPLEAAENAWKDWLSAPERLGEARAALIDATDPKDRHALEGWLRFFGAHTVEDPEARVLQTRIVELESRIHRERGKQRLQYRDSAGVTHDGSTNTMASNISASADETTRRTSHEALLGLESWVLGSGYLELVRLRNAFARALGFPNYFDYRVFKNEGLGRPHLDEILGDFERLTRDALQRSLAGLVARKGPAAILGHNVRFASAGDAERVLDPYLPFERSLEAWCRSFAAMGIGYRGATLTLDLFDRKGKYENGFMHGPFPAFVDHGTWHPARINFTSNATPNLPGSGRRALETLFHEGGHAAHFANIVQDAPCFSHEFPPTSMAYAETQSMFCDSVCGDADWLSKYAKNRAGEPVPDEAIRLFVTSKQPMRAFDERSLLLVPTFESRLYTLPEEELVPAGVLALARACEQEILGLSCAPRPVLSVPHLLGGESACSYQGYLLAHMAVAQTRAFFLDRDGFIADNPRIGPDLGEHYWKPGNTVTHSDTVKSLTGGGLSGRALAATCNLDAEELWRTSVARLEGARVRTPSATTGELDAVIRIVHGSEQIATNETSSAQLWSDFRAWVERHYPRA